MLLVTGDAWPVSSYVNVSLTIWPWMSWFGDLARNFRHAYSCIVHLVCSFLLRRESMIFRLIDIEWWGYLCERRKVRMQSVLDHYMAPSPTSASPKSTGNIRKLLITMHSSMLWHFMKLHLSLLWAHTWMLELHNACAALHWYQSG